MSKKFLMQIVKLTAFILVAANILLIFSGVVVLIDDRIVPSGQSYYFVHRMKDKTFERGLWTKEDGPVHLCTYWNGFRTVNVRYGNKKYGDEEIITKPCDSIKWLIGFSAL